MRTGHGGRPRAWRTLLLGGLVALAIAVPVRLAYAEMDCVCNWYGQNSPCGTCYILVRGCEFCFADCPNCATYWSGCTEVEWGCIER
jgi:hypothetical protein